GQRASLLLLHKILLALLFELLSKRDVASDLRPTDDPTTPIPDRGHRERDRDTAAALRDALRLEVVDSFAPDERREDRSLFRQSLLRQQHRDRSSDGLFRGIAEDALSASIPARDDPREVLADDGIVRRLHDRREHLARPDRIAEGCSRRHWFAA